jgi:thiol:disulfide interchange protein DsbD
MANINKGLFFILLSLLLPWGSFAQMIQDPTKWSFEAKKKSGNTYQLIFHLNLKAGWHIWSLHPGGDGYEISPSFTFANNTHLKLNGAVTEKGKATTTKMEGIDGKITYLNGKIDYIQEVTITGKGKFLGTLNYQVCDDKMCLPPKDQNFVFEVK